jgi:hypothetical protein
MWHGMHAAGEVPDLLGADDLEEVAGALRPIMAQAGMPITKMSIHNFFVSRCGPSLVGDALGSMLDGVV